jgi:aryl-alcohol dehydrogenase-like predicted oxidoreductase
MPLPTHNFGDTGLQLSALGLGLAALGRPGYINLGHAEDLASNYVVDAMKRRTHRLLDLAWKNGIRYFDAARSYGFAEDFLRTWLEDRQIDPQQVVIGSKWGYTYTAEWKVDAPVHEVKEHNLENLDRQWELSRKLQPYLKLYQIHSATLASGVLENTAVLHRLAELKAEGVRVGFSVSGPHQSEIIDQGLAVRIDGERLFDSVQATFNILEQSSGPVLKQAASEGIGIIVKEALANGRLTARNEEEDFRAKRTTLENLAGKYHAGIDAIALAFILRLPWAHLTLSGAATERHLESNLKANKLLQHIPEEEFAELATLKEETEDYWEKRSALNWN